MIENDKVIILQGAKEMADFILNRAMAAGDKYVGEFRDEYLQSHVVGYLENKVVVFDVTYDIRQERQRKREEERLKDPGYA